MRRLSDLSIPEIQRALDDLQRQITFLRTDVGEMSVPTEVARVPRDKSARIYFDEEAGTLVIVTRSGTHTWSED